jgi:Family of unknown function (DUF6232)
MDRKEEKIQISEKLIEIGDNTWQISNLTAISRKEEKVEITTLRPQFNDSEPEGNWRPLGGIGTIIASLVAGIYLRAQFDVHLIFGMLLGAAAGFFLLYDSKAEEKKSWGEKKAKYDKELSVWQELVNNPLTVYSLAFETNSGSRTVFNSFDKDGVERIVQAIKGAMDKPGSVNATYNITTLGQTNITQLGSEILQQTISEIRA